MTTLLIAGLLLGQKGTVHPNGGGGDPISYTWTPYSPDPSSISASVSGASIVSKLENFVQTVTMSDVDTFMKSDDHSLSQKGTSKLLTFAINADRTGIEDNTGLAQPLAFVVFDNTLVTNSDASVVREITYQNETFAPDAYPLFRRCVYNISDSAAAGVAPDYYSIKDTPEVSIVKTVEITANGS